MGSTARYAVWEFNARTEGWLEKGQGVKADMSAWMDAREKSVNERRDTESAYYMAPARDAGPALVPDLLASVPTSGGAPSMMRRLVRYVPSTIVEPVLAAEPVTLTRNLGRLMIKVGQAIEAAEALSDVLKTEGVAHLGTPGAEKAQAEAAEALALLRRVALTIVQI